MNWPYIVLGVVLGGVLILYGFGAGACFARWYDERQRRKAQENDLEWAARPFTSEELAACCNAEQVSNPTITKEDILAHYHRQDKEICHDYAEALSNADYQHETEIVRAEREKRHRKQSLERWFQDTMARLDEGKAV